MKTKVIYLIVVILALSTILANAQTFTAKAGFNLSDIKEKGGGLIAPDYDMKPGFHVGMAAQFPFNTWLSVEPAVLYNSKGAKFKGDFFGTSVDATINLHYLDIPVNFKLTKRMEGNMKVYATAGPYLGVGLAGKIKGKVSGQGGTQTEEQDVQWGSDVDDMYKRTELGATFGLGIEENMVQVGICYDLGLSNNAGNSNDGSSSKNRVLRFSVGYRFGKK